MQFVKLTDTIRSPRSGKVFIKGTVGRLIGSLPENQNNNLMLRVTLGSEEILLRPDEVEKCDPPKPYKEDGNTKCKA